MAIQGISVAYLHSPHGGKLAERYTKTLGFPVEADFGDWTEFKMGSGPRFAIDHTSFPRSVVEKQPVVISFRVDDLRKTVKELSGKGVRFWPSVEKAVFDVGPSLVATFEDPDGNFMQLNEVKKQ